MWKINEIWLLIVIANSRPESPEIFDENIDRYKGFQSNFNKVFILENLKSKIHPLK